MVRTGKVATQHAVSWSLMVFWPLAQPKIMRSSRVKLPIKPAANTASLGKLVNSHLDQGLKFYVTRGSS